MKKAPKIIFAILFAVLLVGITVPASADPTPTPTVDQKPTPTPTVDQKPTVTPTTSPTGQTSACTFDSGSDQLCNPIKQNSLKDIVVLLIKSFMAIIAIFSVAMVVIGGGRLVISAGNEAEVKKAKSTITWAIVGLVIAMLAYSIVSIITNLIQGKV